LLLIFLKEFKHIESHMRTRVLKKKAIFRFPQMLSRHVFFLKEGFLKIATVNPEGEEAIKYLVAPGSLFGEMSLLYEQESIEDFAFALEDSVIFFINSEEMLQLIISNSDLRVKISKQVALRIKKAENRILSILFKDAYTRVCDFIIEFVKEFGRLTEHGYEVNNILTNDDIAKLTSTSRQTVSRILNEVREKKLIEYNNDLMLVPFSSPLIPK
jgi:CRP/FNR family cyclic AMP-dependent transcriptional regulator